MFRGLRAQYIITIGLILLVGVSAFVLVSGNIIQLEPKVQQALLIPLVIATGVLTLLFSYAFFTYAVMRPLRALDVSTRRAADGNFASPVKNVPNNEFGDLAEQFNVMLEKIESQRVSLHKQVLELNIANKELIDTQDSLIRSERLASVGQLAAGIAHEIGNPLAAVQGYVELLDDSDGDERADIQNRLRGQVDRMQEIIRNLLDYSRDDHQEVQPTNLAKCIDETLKLVKAMPRARGIAFVIDPMINVNAKGVEKVRAKAVPSQVVQILVNLSINAIDAIKTERKFGTITYRVEEHGEALMLFVEDDGPGVDPSRKDSIFDPFFTTKDPGEGTGLGLSIVHRMMKGFGGEITLERSAKGATFCLSFPSVMTMGSSVVEDDE